MFAMAMSCGAAKVLPLIFNWPFAGSDEREVVMAISVVADHDQITRRGAGFADSHQRAHEHQSRPKLATKTG